MLKFVTFAVKTQLNVHDLNNETTAGNVMERKKNLRLFQEECSNIGIMKQ